MAEHDNLIREVNEAVRQEQWQKAFKHFGRYIVAITVLIIVATIGYVWWQSNLASKQEAATEKLYSAIKLVEEGNSYKAREMFEALSESGDTEAALLANIWLVKLKHMAGNEQESAALANRQQTEYSAHYKFYPYIDWFSLYQPPLDMIENDETYRLTNMERKAVLHIKNNELDKAAALYDRIAKDSTTPSTMRERAQLILNTYLRASLVTNDIDVGDEVMPLDSGQQSAIETPSS